MTFKEKIENWKTYWEIGDVGAISRRYFVMNAFDGALTMLGVVIGAQVSGTVHASIIILAGISASVAMGISGFSGAYMTETAERKKDLKSLERAMLKPMNDTVHEEASKFASKVTAFVDGGSPALGSFFVILPFIFSEMGLINNSLAFMSSVIATLGLLFILGVYLGKISEEGLFRAGLKMLMVGIVTAILCTIIGTIFPVIPA